MQAIYLGSLPHKAKYATLIGWSPSASFSGDILSKTSLSSIPLGKGSYTRIPFTLGFWLSSSTTFSISSYVLVSGKS